MQSIKLVASDDAVAERAYRKVKRRIVPLLFLFYVASYLDRVNIGFGQLQMKSELHFSDAIYGFAASVFFVGYILFEIPSNLLLDRVGVRKTMMRITVCWGVVSMATMFVTRPIEFYIARFLLGVFEAGLVPGAMLCLTYWFPPRRRAAATALILLGPVVASIIGGPISGWILQNMHGAAGRSGWQWMFLLEGIPSCVLGIVAFGWMVDRPSQASWLTAEEKEVIIRELNAAAQVKKHHVVNRSAFLHPMVYVLAFAQFSSLCGIYVLSFWLPTVIHEMGVTSVQKVGLYFAVPNAVAACTSVLYSKHSDTTGERRWHFAIALFLASGCLFGTTLLHDSLELSILLFSVALAGMLASLPIQWAISSAVLSDRASVAGLAIISSLASLSGVIGPFSIGLIRTHTGSITGGIYAICIVLIAGACGILVAMRAKGPFTDDKHKKIGAEGRSGERGRPTHAG